MKKFITLSILLLGLITNNLYSQTNDICELATPIWCGETLEGSTVDMTLEDYTFCGTSISAPGVWYSMTDMYGMVILSTCGQANFDTKISVFTTLDGTCNNMACVTGMDDTQGCSNNTTEVEFFASPDATYFILVHGYNSYTGDFALTAICQDDEIYGCTDPIALNYNSTATIDNGTCEYVDVEIENDLCSNATNFNLGETILVNNLGASQNEGIWGECWGFGNGEAEQTSVWYSFTTPEDLSTIHIEAVQDGTGTLTDTQFALYEECGGEMIYCDGNSGNGLMSAFTFNCNELLPSTTYLLMIDGWNSDAGTCNLISSVTDCATIEGCTDSLALNYNPNAVIDDGSCEYPCTGTEATLYVCTFDNGNEVGIEVISEGGEIIYSNFDFGNNEIMTYSLCLSDTICYTVNMYNTENTGWYEGYYWINIGNDQISTDYLEYYENFASTDFSLYGPCGDVVLGCTLPYACNYDSLATYNDESCTYPGCTDSTAYNYNQNAGCDDNSCIYIDPIENDFCSTATTINCNETVDGSTIGATFDDGLPNCGMSVTAPGVWYAFEGTGEYVTINTCNGSDYDTKITVLSSLTETFDCNNLLCIATNDDACYLSSEVSFNSFSGIAYYVFVHGYSNQVGNFTLDVSCGELISGCTEAYACNYNPDAQLNDNSCVYPGCMDPEASNFNSEAGCDDDSCQYPCEAGVEAILYVCTFANGEEIGFEILGNNNDIVYSNFNFGVNQIMTIPLCLDDTSCYTINMYNTVNTGWYGGYYWITVDGIQVSTGYPADNENFATAEFSINGPCGELVYGCVDINACNYDSTANQENDSCTYPGCTDITAINYDPIAGCDDDSCEYPEPCETNIVTAVLISDLWSSEMWWTITNDNDVVVMQGEGDPNGFNIEVDPIITTGCLEDGCYTLNMYDTYGDGWNDGGEGALILYIEETQIVIGTINSEFGSIDFGINTDDCNQGEDIYGCMDSLALNYNPNATIEDESCIYFQGADCLAEFIILTIDEENNTIIIVNTSEGENLNYLWDFGDGTTSDEMLPYHVYEVDGTYTVCLTISTDDLSCVGQYCMEITYENPGQIIDENTGELFTPTSEGFTINVISPDMVTIEENSINDAYNVFPNPATDYITISTSSANEMTIHVFDISGKMIYQNIVDSKQFNIPLQSITNGIYILKVQDDNGIFTRRFEVSH